MNEIEKSFEDLIDNIGKLNITDTKKKKLINKTYNVLDQITKLVDSQAKMNKRIADLEEYVYNDFDDIDENTSFVCPYCNRRVNVYMNNKKMDMSCPFCKNEVVLEWSNDND